MLRGGGGGGGEGVTPKAHTLYRNYHFPYTKSVEEGGGGPKGTNFKRTYVIDKLILRMNQATII